MYWKRISSGLQSDSIHKHFGKEESQKSQMMKEYKSILKATYWLSELGSGAVTQ